MKDSIRTPLGKARGLGSAKEGVGHWWMQRVSAVMLIPLSLSILFQLKHFLPEPEGINDLIVAVGSPLNALVLILSVIVAFYHAWLGVQVIVEDYVHGEGTKIACLLASSLFFFFLGAASVFSVLYICFAQMAQMGR